MGTEFPMARSEEEGQSVLLAGTGSGKTTDTPSRRNERKKESAPVKRSKRRKIKDTETESKEGRQTERADASPAKPKRRRRDNQDREQGGGDEREDKLTRRSAEVMGIVFPGSYCDEAKTTPHYWIEDDGVHGGVLFKCDKCLDYLWLPLEWSGTGRLGKMMEILGTTEGYCKFLNRHRPAKLLMAKMQDLRRLAEEVTDKREFAKLADKILSDNEYDRKEVSWLKRLIKKR